MTIRPRGPDGTAESALKDIAARTMPTGGIARACRGGVAPIGGTMGTTKLLGAERDAGRAGVNGFPTGEQVARGMVHGGPCPPVDHLRGQVGRHLVHPPLSASRLRPEPARRAFARGFLNDQA